MRGSLGEVNVADVIVQPYTSKLTGILRLAQGEIKKSLYFKDGSIVFAHSNLKNDRLGEILLKLGKITQDDFQIISRLTERGMRLGQVLFEKGFLTQPQIIASVIYQVQQIIFSVFNWDFGEYEFIEKERPVFEDIIVDLSTPDLLLEGIRNTTNLFVLERGIGEGDEKIIYLNDGAPRLAREEFDFAEQTVLSCIDGKSSLGKVRAMSRLSSYEFGRAMNTLLLCGLIRFQGNEPSVVVPEEDIPTRRKWGAFSTRPIPFDEQPPPSRIQTLTEMQMRELILETERRFQDMTDEEVLKVLPDFTPQEIQTAYDLSVVMYNPPFQSENRYVDLKDNLEFILNRLEKARQNLMKKALEQETLMEENAANAQQVGVTAADSEEDKFPLLSEIDSDSGAEFTELSLPEYEDQVSQIEKQDGRHNGKDESPAKFQELEDPIELREQGRRLQLLGKAKEGEKQLLRALELEPKNIESHFALADFYQRQGLKFKAFKHLNIVLQLQPDNQRALDLLGVKKRKKALYEI
jgi:tetratricopeptide (TPR) repeat protein